MISAYLIIKKESVRVPKKNFKCLGTRPLYLWSIETLLKIPKVTELVINTDAQDLLQELPNNSKIKIIKRPKELLGNHITADDLLKSDIDFFENKDILMTHVTSPFVSQNSFNRAINQYDDSFYDSLFSVTKIQNRFFSAEGTPINHNPEKLIPTQELSPLLLENSCLYLFSKSSFKNQGTRIGKNPIFFELPNFESVDIDTFDDWKQAEIIAHGIHTMSEGKLLNFSLNGTL